MESNKHISMKTLCNHYGCLSKLSYDYRKIISSSKTLYRLSCIGENKYGIEQSRLYQINASNGNKTTHIFSFFSLIFY